MGSKKLLLGLTMVVLTAAQGSALVSQEPEPSYSPDGAWFATATLVGLPRPFPFMDIYTSDATNQGRSGTVLCTLSVGKFASPMGLVSMTPTAHGNWIRTAKNTFAFTAWRILLDEDGRPVGTAKFWGTVTAGTPDGFTGTMNVELYAADGTAFGAFNGTTAGRRIAVESEQQ